MRVERLIRGDSLWNPLRLWRVPEFKVDVVLFIIIIIVLHTGKRERYAQCSVKWFAYVSNKMERSNDRMYCSVLFNWGDWKRETWHRETIEIVEADITRLDYEAPYRKGGHRETCFILRVEAQYM